MESELPLIGQGQKYIHGATGRPCIPQGYIGYSYKKQLLGGVHFLNPTNRIWEFIRKTEGATKCWVRFSSEKGRQHSCTPVAALLLRAHRWRTHSHPEMADMNVGGLYEHIASYLERRPAVNARPNLALSKTYYTGLF